MLDADRGVSFEEGHGKVIEKTLSVQSDLDFRGVLGIVPFGGDRGIRTPNLCDANAALSQLSYIPTPLKL